MRLVAAVAALLRRLRAERGMALLIFVVVAVTSFVVAAGPRLFNHVADDGLRYGVERATAIGRNLQFSTVDRVPADDGRPVRPRRQPRRGDPREAARLGRRAHRREPVRRGCRPASASPTHPSSRPSSRCARRMGSRTSSTWSPVAGPHAVHPDRAACRGRQPEPPVFEIALSAAAADAIGVAVGDRLPAAVDPGDPLLRNTFPRPVDGGRLRGRRDVRGPRSRLPATGSTTGASPTSPSAARTTTRSRSRRPSSRRRPTTTCIRLDLPNRYRWNLFVDVDRLDAGDAGRPGRRTCAGSTPRSSRPARSVPGGCSFARGSSASSSAISSNGRRPRRPCRSPRSDRWPWPPVRSDSSASSSSVAGARRWPWRAAAGPPAGNCWPRNCGRGC